jgi:hypothetical protein
LERTVAAAGQMKDKVKKAGWVNAVLHFLIITRDGDRYGLTF